MTGVFWFWLRWGGLPDWLMWALIAGTITAAAAVTWATRWQPSSPPDCLGGEDCG